MDTKTLVLAVILCMLAMFALGCTTMSVKKATLDVSHCDPTERSDCWAVPKGVLAEIVQEANRADELETAIKFCKKGPL